jgi:hypothetical protein
MIELSVAQFLVLAALVASDPDLAFQFRCMRGSYNEIVLAYSMHHAAVLADIAIRNGATSRPDVPIIVRMLGPVGGGENHFVPIRIDPAAWTAQQGVV